MIWRKYLCMACKKQWEIQEQIEEKCPYCGYSRPQSPKLISKENK